MLRGGFKFLWTTGLRVDVAYRQGRRARGRWFDFVYGV